MSEPNTVVGDTITSEFSPFERFCEGIVPGCVEVGAIRYIQALAAEQPEHRRADFDAAVAEATGWMETGVAIADVVGTQTFGRLRAAVIEAYYSGYRQPGYTGPGGWEATGFADAPMARVARRDFTFLNLTEAS